MSPTSDKFAVRRAVTAIVARYYPALEALAHSDQGHSVTVRRDRLACSCGEDLGPDTPEAAEIEYDKWVHRRG